MQEVKPVEEVKPSVTHPLERTFGCGYNKKDGGWEPHHISKSRDNNEIVKIDTVETFWGIWNNFITPGNIRNASEFYLFVDIPGVEFTGPSNEKLDGCTGLDGKKIRKISEIIVTIKSARRFTYTQMISVFQAASLFLIGNHSKFEDKILGLRLKIERSKTNDEIMHPQLRLWVAVDKNTQEGQHVIDTIKTEFLNGICRDEISFTFAEQVLPKFKELLSDELISMIDKQLNRCLAKFADLQIVAEQPLPVSEFRNSLIQQLEKDSADIVSSLEAELGHGSSETVSTFGMELSNLIVDLKKGNNFFQVTDEVRQQLPREQRDTRGNGKSRGKTGSGYRK